MTIAAYCLCYLEADWLAFNIQYMYDRIDLFSIVIGPSDQSPAFHQPPDLTSEKILRQIPDPQNKIRIYTGDSWLSKDTMTAVATHNLTTDYILQLDADEFWPQETWQAVLAALQSGADRVSAPHLIFWADASHICLDPTGNPHYFAPTRLFRRFPNATLLHFRSGFISPTGDWLASKDTHLPPTSPVLHFGWVGPTRVARKFRFYHQARNLNMPTSELFNQWLTPPSPTSLPPSPQVHLGPNTVTIAPYTAPLDPTLRNFIHSQSRL